MYVVYSVVVIDLLRTVDVCDVYVRVDSTCERSM